MSRLPLPLQRTLRFKDLSISDIDASERIISAVDSAENRGNLPLWIEISKSNPERVVWIRKVARETIAIKAGDNCQRNISLRDEDAIGDILGGGRVLIDVTGLSNDVWAPLLKKAYELKAHTRVLYAEPENYKPHPSPVSSGMFDLSVTFEGLSPLPGFVRLAGPHDEEKCLFVATLGFEGNRPEHLAAQLDPTPKVIPVIGVPGFQLEYPAFTVGCNRSFLEEYRAHGELRYARASCPFEVYESLCDLKKSYPEHYMYLALVGTKPHAIGAIMYAIKNPEATEVMFDYPIKKDGRTSGVGLIHIYDFEGFNGG